MDTLAKAVDYAVLKHRGQTRKGNGEPYINHCGRVAMRIKVARPWIDDEVIASAWLHDTLEDTDATYEELLGKFGRYIANNVLGMTNPSHDDEHKDKPRAERKRIDREHTAKQDNTVKLIKLADRVDNLSDFYHANDGFMYKYAEESKLLLEVIRSGNIKLAYQLEILINKILQKGK